MSGGKATPWISWYRKLPECRLAARKRTTAKDQQFRKKNTGPEIMLTNKKRLSSFGSSKVYMSRPKPFCCTFTSIASVPVDAKKQLKAM